MSQGSQRGGDAHARGKERAGGPGSSRPLRPAPPLGWRWGLRGAILCRSRRGREGKSRGFTEAAAFLVRFWSEELSTAHPVWI